MTPITKSLAYDFRPEQNSGQIDNKILKKVFLLLATQQLEHKRVRELKAEKNGHKTIFK